MHKEVLQHVEGSVLCWLGTVDEHGSPNVSPKEIFCARDSNTLLIANIASPGSMKDIRNNPMACVSLVDIFVQRGCKLKGKTRVVGRGEPAFEALAEPLVRTAGERFPFATLFEITVTAVEPVLALSYQFYGDTSEAKQVESAMRTYGVQPL